MRKPHLRLVVSYGNRQGLLGPHQNNQFLRPCYVSIDQISLEEEV